MSRVGMMPIEIPEGVEVNIEGNKVSVKYYLVNMN